MFITLENISEINAVLQAEVVFWEKIWFFFLQAQEGFQVNLSRIAMRQKKRTIESTQSCHESVDILSLASSAYQRQKK